MGHLRGSALALATALLTGACASGGPDAAAHSFVLAMTTSVDDSGLMDALLAAFDSAHPEIAVRLVAVGSGEALAMGRRGDADLLITHAPADEARFLADGRAADQRAVMHSHFIIAGPASDPADVRAAASASDAFRRIAERGAPFLSRGDSSGTHRRELAVWWSAGVGPEARTDAWYVESGTGMGDLLRVAGERSAYTLADRATFLRYGSRTGLVLLYDDGGEALFNPYTATLVAGAVNGAAAQVFLEWLTGEAGRAVIDGFGVEAHGGPLFIPSGPP